MNLRFVTKTMHAYLDYPVAVILIVAPFGLQLGGTQPLALWLSVTTGVAAFLLTLLTDHKLGLFRVVPYAAHLAVDFLVGALFLIAPGLLGFTGVDAWYYLANGAAVLLVVGLHKPEKASARDAAFKRAALAGYDPVAYFTEGRATKGRIEHNSHHAGKQYFFASDAHRQMFERDPERFLPQFAGYCAYGVAMGQLFDVDPRTGQVIDDKLYLNLNRKILSEFNQDARSYINQANDNWPAVAQTVAA